MTPYTTTPDDPLADAALAAARLTQAAREVERAIVLGSGAALDQAMIEANCALYMLALAREAL